MSSHREAPRISQDPAADNTDLYAFVDPVDTNKITILANFVPLQEPAGGPNFFQFGDDVLYEIMIDNNGDGLEDVTYQFRFKTVRSNPTTFLYNTGPITSLNDGDWNIRQFYSVTRIRGLRRKGQVKVLGSDLSCPPVRIGPRSTPDYAPLANAAINPLPGGGQVFAGQRDEGFFVDLGSIFDLGTLRPFQDLHLISTPPQVGKDDTKGYNVHTIALQVKKTDLVRDGHGTDPTDPMSTIGVWASASRQESTIRDAATGSVQNVGPWVQVSRLGMPLINEVIIPVGKKDFWNSQHPMNDAQFLQYYTDPELQNLLPFLYPAVFPNLAAFLAMMPKPPRTDLVAILLTGVPGLNFTGTVQADVLRVNTAIPPSSTPSQLGLLGGDIAGFPNGRRVFDDAVDIELRAIAGIAGVAPFTPDGAAALLLDRLANVADRFTAGTLDPGNDTEFLSSFPYLGHPHEGYEHSHDP